MKRLFSLIIAIIMAAAALSGCAGNTGDGDTIKIGGLAPLTGDVAVYGTAVANAVKLAFEEINAKGGVLGGKKLVYDVLDEKGDVTEAVTAYNRLKTQNIVALIGDVTSKPTIGVAELAGKDGIPMITPTATNESVTTYGKNIFRACYLDPFQGKTMAVFATENLKAKKVAVIYNSSDDYSTGVAEAFKKEATERGAEVVSYESYGQDDKDFKAQLTNISANEAEVLFVPDYYNRVVLIADQSNQIGLKAKLIGVDGWDGVLDVIDKSKVSVLDNTYFCNHYSDKDTAENVVNFLKNYEAKYNKTPNALAALGYDAAYILAEAINKAGSTDKDKIVAAMQETSFDGVTGHITFDENRNPIKSVSIIKILNGGYVLDSKITPQ